MAKSDSDGLAFTCDLWVFPYTTICLFYLSNILAIGWCRVPLLQTCLFSVLCVSQLYWSHLCHWSGITIFWSAPMIYAFDLSLKILHILFMYFNFLKISMTDWFDSPISLWVSVVFCVIQIWLCFQYSYQFFQLHLYFSLCFLIYLCLLIEFAFSILNFIPISLSDLFVFSWTSIWGLFLFPLSSFVVLWPL